MRVRYYFKIYLSISKSGTAYLNIKLMRANLILLLLILLFNIPAYAQTNLSGKVTDKNGEVLVGAAVMVKDKNLGAITDTNGEYSINLSNGKHRVIYSFIGYKKVSRNIIAKGKPIKQNVPLTQTAEALREVVVTAKSQAREIREQAMPIAVIDIKEIQGTVSDVNEVLAKTSGVTMRNTGGVGSSSRMSVRGLEGKRIGFFIDGIPMSDNTDYLDVNDIPVDMIERIEIYKGIVPAKFGGNTMGGAINLVIREYPPAYADLSYSIASFNTHKVSALVKRTNAERGHEFGIGGFYTYADNNYEMELPLQKGRYVTRDHDVYIKKTFAAGFKAKKWWFDEVVLEPVIIFSEKAIQGIEYNIQGARQDLNMYAFLNQFNKANFITEGLELEISNNYIFSIIRFMDKAVNRYAWDGSLNLPIHDLGGEIRPSPNDARNLRHTFTQRTNLNYVFNEQHSINLNSLYNYVNGQPRDTLMDKALGKKLNHNSDLNSWICGLSYDFYTLDKKFTNVLSGKYYYYAMNTIYTHIFNVNSEALHIKNNDYGLSNALRYRFTSTFLAKASLGYDVRMPGEEELLGDGFLIAPATNLKPERNISANFGLMYDKLTGNNRLQLEANVFYMQVSDMIRFTGGPLQSKYENFGEMRTIGCEFEAKWDVTHWLYLWGNITYQDLRDTREKAPGSSAVNPTKDYRIPNIPYLFSNAGIEIHKANLFGGKGQNSRLFADCSFIEEYFYDFELSDYQERRIPRSTMFNAGLEHSLFNQGVTIGLQVNNLTDTKVLSEFNRPLPGRNFAFKVRYIWKKE